MSDLKPPILAASPPPARLTLAGETLDGNGPLTRQVYRLLRDLIVGMRLLPNQFLSEKDVAAELKISKTPVREAFIRLSEDGMVRIIPKSGTYVAPIDIRRVSEGYFIWIAIESSCALLVAENRTLDDMFLLRKMLSEQESALAAEDYLTYYNSDTQFHEEMFRIAGCPNAKRLIMNAKFEVDRLRNLRRGFRMRPVDEVVGDHAAIVSAIAKRDSDAARAAMYKHLSKVRDSLESLFDNHDLWNFFHQMDQTQPNRRGPRMKRRGGRLPADPSA